MLLKGNCLKFLAKMPDNSVDSIVTDPPYELGFMGKSWDNSGIAYNVELWSQALRVLKPGGHLLAFGGSRTYHRLASAVEDAGFEIRDQIMWIYGSGFPKSLNLKDEWQGWGTALKPAHEPIVVARKPLIGTVATNVLTYGTGALNIDGSRVAHNGRVSPAGADGKIHRTTGNTYAKATTGGEFDATLGRWPANVIHDGSEKVLEYFGEPQRFFYCAKASKSERNAGLEGFEIKRPDERTTVGMGTFDEKGVQPQQNFHPTVKPVSLMRYLVKLVTPPNGTVLDPFLGSGTTAVASILEGFNWMGCEMTEDYWSIIEARVKWAESQPKTLL
jgi:site-specific DNA-methyltransferase (adenine-specific)